MQEKNYLAFNCPPEYGNEVVKPNNFPKKKESKISESAGHVTEFSDIA